MFDALVEQLGRISERWKGTRAALWRVLAIVGVAVGVLAAVPLLPWELAQATVGSLAGLALFSAAYLLWATALPAEWHDRLNIRGTWPLPRRRLLFIWLALAWAALALVVGSYVGGSVVAGATVAWVMGLWRMATATPAEIDEINAEAEEIAELQTQAAEEALEDATLLEFEDRPRRRRWWSR